MSVRIDQLRDVVVVMHKCKARRETSVPPVEMFGNKTVREGVVESLAITGHPKAKRCYAWSFLEGNEPRYTTVLEIPPVESPQTAVRASIVAEGKKRIQ